MPTAEFPVAPLFVLRTVHGLELRGVTWCALAWRGATSMLKGNEMHRMVARRGVALHSVYFLLGESINDYGRISRDSIPGSDDFAIKPS